MTRSTCDTVDDLLAKYSTGSHLVLRSEVLDDLLDLKQSEERAWKTIKARWATEAGRETR